MNFDDLVYLERKKQDEKWGEQNHGFDRWLTILMEEIGEMSKASLEEGESNRFWGLEYELIQAAAVLKVMWESGKRNGWL